MYLKRTPALITFGLVLCSVKSQDIEKSYSTSVTGMEELLEIERQLIESVHKYTDELQKKVVALKYLVNELKEENQKSYINPEKYLSNPLNAYALIRRMHYDWPYIEKFMIEPIGLDFLKIILKYRPLMTTARDITEASDGMYRLQMVYDLNPLEMSDGLINGKQYDAKLKSIDRYFMGQHLYSQQLYYDASIWLNSSLMSYEENTYYKIIDFGKEKVLKLYADTLIQQNYTQSALIAIKQALDLQPNDERLLERKNEIQLVANVIPEAPIQYSKPALTVPTIACRGGFTNFSSKLYCVYNTTTSQFLHLAPLKMEILQWDPFMAMFHDVLSDLEIEHIKSLAKPNLARHTFYNNQTARYEVFDAKIRKYFNILFNATDIVKRINLRIAGIAGFPMKRTFLHVASYGLGGHIIPHYDTPPASLKLNPWDHRVPTILFYMSDVEQGGATIFPNIPITVYPRKGSALVFENLYNGENDKRTLHAGCPVLVGSKWVSV